MKCGILKTQKYLLLSFLLGFLVLFGLFGTNVKKSFADDSFFGSVYINEIEFPYNKNDLGLTLPENQDFFFVDSIIAYSMKPLSSYTLGDFPNAYVGVQGNIKCILDGDQNSAVLIMFNGISDSPVWSGPTTWRNGGGEFYGHSCVELEFNPPVVCLDSDCTNQEVAPIFAYFTLSAHDPLATDRSIEFGLAILIVMFFLITLGYIFNSINKKPNRY